MKIQSVNDRIEVSIGKDLFTAFNYRDTAKPFLYPVFAPDQTRMTRDFPMKESAGEGDDHPHHQSIWVGHEVSGVDFWHCKNGEKILVDGAPVISAEENSVVASSQWIDASGKVICRDQTTWFFGSDDKSRWIDCELILKATESDITIDDTKEGIVAIRTHPDLRLSPDPDRGVNEVFGSAVNSNGSEGGDLWGQPAAWVLYTGQVETKPTSLLILDHPDNFRHPTTWHARDYGLVAANPFGLHHFQKLKEGAGAVKLLKTQTLTLRYRFQFSSEIVTTEAADESWSHWTQPREKSSPQ